MSIFPKEGTRSSREMKGNTAEADTGERIGWGHREDQCHCRTGGELYQL